MSEGATRHSSLKANAEMPALIVTNDQARVYNMRLGEARILVDRQRSGGACWMGRFREDPGFLTPLHVHPGMDEYFFVLDGVLSLYVGDQWQDLAEGSFAVAKQGLSHAQGNFSGQPVNFLSAGTPAGFEEFFAAQHELLKRMPPSDPNFVSQLLSILRAHGTVPQGPAPSRHDSQATPG
jgi:quercetin dioxygenase-like cupin family protein